MERGAQMPHKYLLRLSDHTTQCSIILPLEVPAHYGIILVFKEHTPWDAMSSYPNRTLKK